MNEREKVVAKNGPFSLTFCQIVALMVPHYSVVAGRLDEVLVAMPYKCLKRGGEALLSSMEEIQPTSFTKACTGSGGPQKIKQRK